MTRSAIRLAPRAFVVAALAGATALAAQGPAPRKAGRRAPPSPAPTATATAAAAVGSPLTATDVGAFLDGVIPQQLQREDIAGAVVAVVKDGQVLFARGYGWADVKARTPVSVDATLFRIGSISKTFTWTAVMQLVEQGKIDLDADMNTYLDFRIPAPFGKPVTMKDLMTHTPGFEESIKDLFVPDTSYLTPLSAYLPRHLPRQIFPPGTTPAYSNYGATLAGYIVQRVSGVPFDDYVERNILQPLGMTRATFRQPLPDALAPFMSTGYARASGKAKAFEVVQVWPAGSVAASAESMTHWMIAHLQDGAYGNARILQAATAQRMHARLFGLTPDLNAMCYGFYEESRNGHRIIGHGGDTQWFHSDMHLMPDDHIGFFIAYNSAGKGEISPRTEIWRAVLDRYFPYTPPAAPAVATAKADLAAVAGRYESSRRQQTSILSLASTLGQETVKADTDGTITTGAKDFAGNLKHFEEIAPMEFREVHGQDRVAFVPDSATGQMRLVGDFPAILGMRTPMLRNQNLNLAALLAGLGMFCLTMIFWPVNAMLRRHYGARPALAPEYRRARRYERLAILVNLVFIAWWAQTYTAVQTNIGVFSSRHDGTLHVMQAMGVLALLGLPVAIWAARRAWSDRSLWFWAKVWNTLLAIAFAGWTFFVLNARLLDFALRY